MGRTALHRFIQLLQHRKQIHRQKLVIGIMISLAVTPVIAADLTLYSAGSLRAAMTALIAEFTQDTGIHITPSFGASGTWRTKIEGGDVPDIFASANLEHPQALQKQGVLKRLFSSKPIGFVSSLRQVSASIRTMCCQDCSIRHFVWR